MTIQQFSRQDICFDSECRTDEVSRSLGSGRWRQATPGRSTSHFALGRDAFLQQTSPQGCTQSCLEGLYHFGWFRKKCIDSSLHLLPITSCKLDGCSFSRQDKLIRCFANHEIVSHLYTFFGQPALWWSGCVFYHTASLHTYASFATNLLCLCRLSPERRLMLSCNPETFRQIDWSGSH